MQPTDRRSPRHSASTAWRAWAPGKVARRSAMALTLGCAAGAAPTGVDAAALDQYEVRESRILHGAIRQSIPDVADLGACAEACDSQSYCRSFTFIPSRRVCELKADNRFVEEAYGGYVSGISRADGITELIAGIATGVVRQGDGTQDPPKVEVGAKTSRKGATAPDGTASGFVCQQQTVSLEQQSEEFITLNPTQEWLYPGALLQGATIQGGTPTWIKTPRSAGRIGLALQTGSKSAYVEDVPRMDRLSTLQAVNNLLSRYEGGTPGEISITQSEVHSQEHLEAMLGANVTGANFSAGASFSMNFEEEKTRLLIRVVQKFYTVVFEPPRYPKDVFGDGVTVGELQRWMGPGNPPVYVSMVNYGRMLFALVESNMSARELKAAFDANYSAIVEASAEGSADYRRELSNTDITIISFGASAAGGLTGAADVAQYRNFDGLYDFLRTSGDFGPFNPGVPISYQMRSLYDSRPVRLAATTEYTKNLCTPAVFGCDGDPGSGKRLDQCGVCGGTDRCKRPCRERTVTLGNTYAFVYFDLPETPIGQTVRFKDGRYWVGRGLRCYSVDWDSTRFTCQGSPSGGKWKDSKSWTREAWCHGASNYDQPNMRVEKK